MFELGRCDRLQSKLQCVNLKHFRAQNQNFQETKKADGRIKLLRALVSLVTHCGRGRWCRSEKQAQHAAKQVCIVGRGSPHSCIGLNMCC